MPAPITSAIDFLILAGGISAVVFVLLMVINYARRRLSPTRIDASDLYERLSFTLAAFLGDLLIFLGVGVAAIFAIIFVQHGLSTQQHIWTAAGILIGLLSSTGLPAIQRFTNRASEVTKEVTRLKSIIAGRCPTCGSSLSRTDDALCCLGCDTTFALPRSLRQDQTTTKE